MTPTAGLTRRNHGRGHSYRIDGEKVPGVTTILGATMPKQALIEWAGKTTAGFAVDHWDELGELPPSKRLERLNKARFEDRDTAAGRGTEVHLLAEQHMAGAEVEIPEELEGHFRSYEQFIAEWDPQPVLIEAVLGNRAVGYAGTVDVVADLADHHRWLLDYKTTRSGIFPETALQLCAYRRAEVYIDQDGAEQQLEDLGIDRVGALHLRADGYSIKPVTADDEVWTYFRHLAWLYRQAERLEEWVGSDLRAPLLRAVS
jgi:hypothetical protein